MTSNVTAVSALARGDENLYENVGPEHSKTLPHTLCHVIISLLFLFFSPQTDFFALL